MLLLSRIAFGVSFGFMALGAIAVAVVALRRSRRYALLASGKSPQQLPLENIAPLTPFEYHNRIKRPPFLPQSGGSYLRD